MSVLPRTDGAIPLDQGKDFAFKFKATDSETKLPIDFTGYGFRMQIRESSESEDVILDVTPYADLTDIATGVVQVVVPGGITKTIGGHVDADWIADAEFYLIGSDPESVQGGGRLTINFRSEITR